MRFRPPLPRAEPSHVSSAVSPSWRTSLYATCIAQAAAMVAFGFVLPFLALYLKQLNVGSENAVILWSGALVTSTAVALAVASPIWGALADRHGRKLMVLRAMLVGGLIMALMGFVQNAGELLVLRILQGAFTGTIAASTALVATSVPKDQLAPSMGLLQTSGYLGIAGGPMVGGVIAELIGIRGTFVVAGALLAGSGLLVWQFVHEHFPPPSTQRRPGLMASLRAGIMAPALAPLLVAVFLIQISSAIVFPILPLFVERISGAGDPVKLYSGLAFGVTAVSSALAALGYSRFVDRAGYRRVLVFASLAAACLFAPMAIARNVPQLLLLRAGVGLFFGALIPATNAIIGLVTPGPSRGSAYGLTSSATALGTAAGPLLGSTLAAILGLPSIFVASAVVLALLGFWVMALVPEPAVEAR